jgi:hypothetical protein
MSQLESAILHTLLLNLAADGYQPAAVFDGKHYLMPEQPEARQLKAFPALNALSAIYTAEQLAPAVIYRPLTSTEILTKLEANTNIIVCFTRRGQLTWRDAHCQVILELGDDYLTIAWYEGDKAFEGIMLEVSKIAATLGD